MPTWTPAAPAARAATTCAGREEPPARVGEVVVARLDALPVDVRTVVQSAAVLGPQTDRRELERSLLHDDVGARRLERPVGILHRGHRLHDRFAETQVGALLVPLRNRVLVARGVDRPVAQQRLAIRTAAQAALLLPERGAERIRSGMPASGSLTVRGERFLYAARRNGDEAIVILRPAAQAAALAGASLDGVRRVRGKCHQL